MARRNNRILKAVPPPPSGPTPPDTPQEGTSGRQLFEELGVSGVRHFGGQIFEEIIKELQGSQRYKKLKEFRENNDTVGAIFFVIEQLVRGVQWKIVPFDQTLQADVDQATFISEVLFEDMEDAWPQHVVAAMDANLSYGFAYHEIVYKVRGGDQPQDPNRNSKFDDNRIGLRRIALRPADTLLRWDLTEQGDVLAFRQSAIYGASERTIPIDKALHYRFRTTKNNPEGKPLLRSAYPSWAYLKGIQTAEAIGISRNCEGLVIAWVPPATLDPTTEAGKQKPAFEKLVTSIGMNEQRGIVYPLAYDKSNNKMYDLTLLTGGGDGGFAAGSAEAITRYQHSIAQSVLAQWLFFGLTDRGTQALSTNITEIFAHAVNSILDEPTSIINATLIPRILRLNGMDISRMPKLTHSEVAKPDLTMISTTLNTLASAGFDVVGALPGVLNWVAEEAGLPRPDQEDLAEE